MARSANVLFALLCGALAGFGWVADRALLGQLRRAEQESERETRETAQLVALAVRGAGIARVEQRVLARNPPAGVLTDRLAVAPNPGVPSPGFRPYRSRPRSELATLLHSTASTPSGLPEAVLARFALGDAAAVSVAGEPSPPDVASRLLAGALPVRPDDLPLLARALGVSSDPRAAALGERLRNAPDKATLPRAPAFRRVRLDERLEGWTLDGSERVRYEVPVATLLQIARVQPGVSVVPKSTAPAPGTTARVPDVEALTIAVPQRAGDVPRLRVLRAALWLAAAASLACLFAIRGALAAQSRATARERMFLANVTHELRTPLTAMRLLAERLAQGSGDPRDYGGLIAEESLRLEALVERVLAATRASEQPRFAPVEPAQLLRSAVALVSPRAERREVSLTCNADAPLPTVNWDAEAVRRALVNLLDNAIKHGREGGRVEAGAFAEGAVICLRVRDDGPGIARRVRKHLFGRFARGETEAPGTGLGLHFAEQVARAHGGRIDLVSEEGKGCVFTLRLPALPAAAESR